MAKHIPTHPYIATGVDIHIVQMRLHALELTLIVEWWYNNIVL